MEPCQHAVQRLKIILKSVVDAQLPLGSAGFGQDREEIDVLCMDCGHVWPSSNKDHLHQFARAMQSKKVLIERTKPEKFHAQASPAHLSK